MKALKEIGIYLIDKRNVRTIDVVQYDTGIQLVFNVKDFEIPSGTTATLYVQKPSGKFVYQEDGITVAADKITINLENQAITEHGKVPYQISLKNGTDEITSFTGLMMVQASLKDAGSTESKTVIRAFDNAVLERVAQFRSQAETIAAAVIATIPEDYTAMEAKVNELANAIKGHLTGYVVAADDVSPVEHEMVVNVKPKNLFDITKIQPFEDSTSAPSVTAVDMTTITITTNENYSGNGNRSVRKTLKELCPQLEVGKTYILTAETMAYTKIIYLLGSDKTWIFGKTMTITQAMLDSEVVLYGFHSDNNGYGDCVISNIQIEEGNTPTEYTPYIDPATVNVRRCGKNIFDIKKHTVVSANLTTNEHTGNDYTVQGTVGNAANAYSAGAFAIVPPKMIQNINAVTFSMYVTLLEQGAWGNAFRLWAMDENIEYADYKTFELEIGKRTRIQATFLNENADVISRMNFHVNNNKLLFELDTIQIEEGTDVTEYEPYKGTEHTPSSDGTVSGMMSVSPNMTILTDTEGVIVECEYNKDTNKVIKKLSDALGVTI